MRAYRQHIGWTLFLGLTLLLQAGSPLNFSNQHPPPPAKIHWVQWINQTDCACIDGWPSRPGEYVPDEYDINFWDGAHNIIVTLQVKSNGSWQYLTNEGRIYNVQTTPIWLVSQQPSRHNCSGLGYTPASTYVAPSTRPTPRPTPGRITPPTPTPRSIAAADVRFQVKRETSSVWAGDPTTLPELRDDNFYSLQINDRVKTDEQGEALLKRPSSDPVCRIYVYLDSILKKSDCAHRSANPDSSCVEQGAATYWDCGGHLITTEARDELRVRGSWVLVIYLPARQQTLLTVFEGRVEARPAINPGTGTLGQATTVDQGYFWFTNPGRTGDPIAGLDARRPYPLNQLRPVINTLDLWPWFERVESRATLDKIPYPDWLITKECTVTTGQSSLWHGPGPNYGAIRSLADGTRLMPLKRTNDGSWILVGLTNTGQIGWVVPRANWLTCNIDLMTLPPVNISSQPLPAPSPTINLPPEQIVLNAPCETCTTLSWNVSQVRALFINGESLPFVGNRRVCLSSSDAYTLDAGHQSTVTDRFVFSVDTGSGEVNRTVNITWQQPQISFYADNTTLSTGQCTTLRWAVDGVQAVYFNGKGVAGHSSRTVCPAQSEIHRLRIATPCGEEERQIQLIVDQPAPSVQAIVVTGGGGLLNEDNVQQALLDAVLWRSLNKTVFPGQDVPVEVTMFGSNQIADARNITYNPNKYLTMVAAGVAPTYIELQSTSTGEPELSLMNVLEQNLDALGVTTKRKSFVSKIGCSSGGFITPSLCVTYR